MTDFRASGEAVPIERIDQLVEEFHRAGKPRDAMDDRHRVREARRRARARGAPSASRGRVASSGCCSELAERFGWEPKEENGGPSRWRARQGVDHPRAGRPGRAVGRALPHAARDAPTSCATHVEELSAVGRELGIVFLGLGMQPVSTLDDIEWVPKQRYAIMREYMPRVGIARPPHDEADGHRPGQHRLRRRARRHAQAAGRHGARRPW